jgi:uracil-DNA glycosylase
MPADAEVVFHGEAPGKNEIIQGSPFVGKAGFVLEFWLLAAVPKLKVLWDQKKVGLANCLRCLPPLVQGRPYPQGDTKRAAEAACRQYDNWPDTVHTVVLFGENAQRLHFAKELEAEDKADKLIKRDMKGVMGRIGRVYIRDNKRWIFAPHPAWILRQPSLTQHGQAALQIAADTASFFEPEYSKWANTILQVLKQ